MTRVAAFVLALVFAAPAAASDDPMFRYQWNIASMRVPQAWKVTRGEGVTVAVLDSGVAYEDRGRFRRAPDLAKTRFARGWDFVDDDSHPDDVPPRDGRRTHGTQIASIIAAGVDNGIGSAGVAPGVTLMPIRVLDPDLNGSARVIARGLRYAADHAADVANLSISGELRTPVLASAIAYATAKGVTVVAASGNDGAPAVAYPAADARAIAVGATTRDGKRADYSNFGAALDLVAPAGAGELVDNGFGPGDGIVGQTLKGGPRTFCLCFTASTSAAAAEVSAVAALVIASGRGADPSAVKARLQDTAHRLGSRAEYGAGLVDAAAAVGVPEPARRHVVRAKPRSSGGPPWLAIAVAAVALAAVAVALARRRPTSGS